MPTETPGGPEQEKIMEQHTFEDPKKGLKLELTQLPKPKIIEIPRHPAANITRSPVDLDSPRRTRKPFNINVISNNPEITVETCSAMELGEEEYYYLETTTQQPTDKDLPRRFSIRVRLFHSEQNKYEDIDYCFTPETKTLDTVRVKNPRITMGPRRVINVIKRGLGLGSYRSKPNKNDDDDDDTSGSGGPDDNHELAA